MKKSNKILVGGLVTIILLLLAINLALNARFKAGKYTSFNEVMESEALQVKEFANAKSIDIRHLYNVHVRLGNTLKIEHHGNDISEVVITEKNGTVMLSATDSVGKTFNYTYIVVYVPNTAMVNSYKALLLVEGYKNSKIGALSFNATDSRVIFQQETRLLEIDSLNIEGADKSFIDFQNTRIDKLAVRLRASELRDEGASLNQFSLEADTASQVNLQSKNLIKLTTKTTAHE